MKKHNNILAGTIVTVAFILLSTCNFAQVILPGAAGAPYPNMPGIAPIGERIQKHIEVNESDKGPAIDPARGYRLQELGKDLYMITDNAYQSMFMV